MRFFNALIAVRLLHFISPGILSLLVFHRQNFRSIHVIIIETSMKLVLFSDKYLEALWDGQSQKQRDNHVNVNRVIRIVLCQTWHPASIKIMKM